MGKPNTGYVMELANGKFKAILELPPVNGKRTKMTRTCETRGQAKKALAGLLLKREVHMKNQRDGIIPFKKAIEEYRRNLSLKQKLGQIKEKTAHDYEGFLKKLEQEFKYTSLNKMTSAVLDNYYKRLLTEENLSSAYVAKLNIILSGIFKASKIAFPEISFKYNNKRDRGNKVHPFSTNELGLLNQYFREHHEGIMPYIYAFALTTGCRIGEVAGLKWNCLYPEDDIIEIKNTIIYISGKGLIEETPKTIESHRRLVVPHSLFNMLLVDLKEHYRKHNINNTTYVFSSKNDTPLSPRNILRDWQKICRKAGLENHHTFHDLRHTNITLKIAKGIDVKTVSIMAGHADISVTLNTYSHYWKEAAQRAADIFKDIPLAYLKNK